MSIPTEFIEKVKLANNIVTVAARYIPLKAKGRMHWGLCPFHHEKSPSFAINETQQFFKCFGCGVAGNVITLVKQFESTDFIGAIEVLAKAANLEMPRQKMDPAYLEKKQKRERALEILEQARDFYCRELYKDGNRAMLDYLHGRGITDELIKMFNIGASPNWDAVLTHLKAKGFTEAEIIDSGVAARGERGNVYDAMGGRITFAIFDIYGGCIGFTGRIMSTDRDVAKYKNTAQTMVFDKGNLVYGIDVLKKNKLSAAVDKLVVVEGNVDVITLVGAGFTNTVACMGTALTPFHAKIFGRFSKNIYLTFDGDRAGRDAALRALDILDAEGLDVRVVSLPPDTDPDTFVVKNGPQALTHLLDTAVPAMDYRLDRLQADSDLRDNLGRTRYMKRAAELLRTLGNGPELELYLPRVARVGGVSPDAIARAVYKSGVASGQKGPKPTPPTNNPDTSRVAGDGMTECIRFLVAATFLDPPITDIDKLGSFVIKDNFYRKLIDTVKQRRSEGSASVTIGMIFDEFDDEEKQRLDEIANYEFNMTTAEIKKHADECIKRLDADALKHERQKILDAASDGTVDQDEAARQIYENLKRRKLGK